MKLPEKFPSKSGESESARDGERDDGLAGVCGSLARAWREFTEVKGAKSQAKPIAAGKGHKGLKGPKRRHFRGFALNLPRPFRLPGQ